jgi:hypothetical protein
MPYVRFRRPAVVTLAGNIEFGGFLVGKLISAVVAGVIGVVLAGTAAWSVVSSVVAAPEQNPVDTVAVIPYGNR